MMDFYFMLSYLALIFEAAIFSLTVIVDVNQVEMKKVNKQCLLDTPRTVRVSEKTWQVIVRTRIP